jgi:phytoene dehydrogenase-like protein
MSIVVIGAGPDELVAAHLLARAGRRVTVLEEHASHPGEAWLPPRVTRALDVALRVTPPDPWLRALLPDGGVLELEQDLARSVEAIRRVSPRDAAQWPDFTERVARVAGVLEGIYLRPAPSLVDLRFALRVRALGRSGMEDLMRWLPMPVAELLDEWFECDALKGALGALALRHLHLGPRAAGTAFGLLHAQVGNARGVFRAPRPDLGPLRSGIDLRPAKASTISVRRGRVAGVGLEGGEELPAALVVSGAAPRRTLLELVEPGWLDPDLARALRNVRARGVAARVTLELERAAPFASLTYAPSLDHLERAHDDAKYGRISEEPYLDARVDGAAAEIHFQYAPYRLADRWNAAARDRVLKLALSTLGKYLGETRSASVLAPPDLEALEGWPEGQPHYAELALDQALWMRPLAELAAYSTPIEGLWLCGPAMHPGAGVVGASGHNCAQRILSTLRA